MIMFLVMMMMMMGNPQNIGKLHHFLILLDLIEQNGKMTYRRFKDYSMFFELLVFFMSMIHSVFCIVLWYRKDFIYFILFNIFY